MGRRGGPSRKPPKSRGRNQSARSNPSPSDEGESDEDYGRSAKRRPKASGGASTARATRSRAGRVEPKSYYEESDEDEYAVPQGPVEEEDDGEAIESVWSHQSVGTAQRRQAANENTAPKVDAGARARKVDWEGAEFYVKWKGRSYIHNTWEALATLEGLPGFKRVVNYMKRVELEQERRAEVSPEEAELMDVQKEMDLEMIEQYTQVKGQILPISKRSVYGSSFCGSLYGPILQSFSMLGSFKGTFGVWRWRQRQWKCRRKCT